MTAELDAFNRHGFLGPLKLLSTAECSVVLRHAATLPRRAPSDWAKAGAASDRLLFDVATRPSLLELLTALLGDDVVLWGASIVRRRPGETHSWHTDIESSAADGRFVSAWIGLENSSTQSSLQLVDGSHSFGRPLQQDVREHGLRRGELSDDAVLALARRHDSAAELVQLSTTDGHAILFDGRIWHGSHNRRREGIRTALLVQYAAAGQPVYRPDSSRLDWPFQFLATPRPPVVVVSGSASPEVNCLVAPPEPLPGSPSAVRADVLTVVRQLALPLEEDPVTGWKSYPIFRGATPTLELMSCHVSVLGPGRSPHPPHVHLDEELLIVLDGAARLVIAEREDDPAPRVEAVAPGDFAYYPAYQHHTIRNDGPTPVTYLMFKWRAAPPGVADPLATGIFRYDGSPAAAVSSAFDAKLVFEKPTFFLGKLHAHVSTLQAGAGYGAHRDEYDAAIIVLAGRIETFGQDAGGEAAGDSSTGSRGLGPHGVIYHAAGQSHGLCNRGSEAARYLVFEFHASATDRARRRLPALAGVGPLAQSDAMADGLAHERRWICRRRTDPPREPDRFDAAWYLTHYPDVAAAGADPQEHYRRFGAAEGRMPSPVADGDGLFDAATYLRQNPDVAAAGVNPFEHYLQCGAAEGRRARAQFDSAWYSSQEPAARQSSLNPLVHYFKHGRQAGRSPHPGAMPDGSPPPLHESIDWKSPADIRGQIAAYLAQPPPGPRRIVICTAIFGGRDSLMLPDRIDPEIDYVCFSDEAWDGQGIWQIRPGPYRHPDPVRMARYVKTHLAELFPTHEVAVWVDANIAIRGDVKAYVDAVRRQGSALGAITHPFRKCVYEEGQVCKWDGKDAPDIIDRQMERYRRAGVPRDDGLFETSLYVLRLDQPRVAAFQQVWWREIESYSRRDQLSLGWALRRTGLRVARLLPPDRSIRDHEDFSLFPHDA